jgi:predicted outer membrane repeat protein
MRPDAQPRPGRAPAAWLLLVAAVAAALAFPESADALRRFVPREHATLQGAIDAASPGDTLWVAGGVYRGPFTLTKRLVLYGEAGPDSTILDGGDSVRVLHVEGVNGGALIGFGIRGGKGVGGGGVYLLRDTTFAIDACVFRRNWESGIAAWDCRTLRIADCRFEENLGSAMQWNDTNGFIRGLRFTGNKGHGGGAIALHRSQIVTPARNCAFEGNRAETTVGGAIYADSSRAVFLNCDFVGNSSAVSGGAVAAMARSHLTLSRSVFRENRAAQGGALHSDASHFLVGFSIFDRNRSTAGGAAIGMLGRIDANINPILQNNTFYAASRAPVRFARCRSRSPTCSGSR